MRLLIFWLLLTSAAIAFLPHGPRDGVYAQRSPTDTRMMILFEDSLGPNPAVSSFDSTFGRIKPRAPLTKQGVYDLPSWRLVYELPCWDIYDGMNSDYSDDMGYLLREI